MADGANHVFVQRKVVSPQIQEASAIQGQCCPSSEYQICDDARICALPICTSAEESEQEQARHSSCDNRRNRVPERECGSLIAPELDREYNNSGPADSYKVFCDVQSVPIGSMQPNLAVKVLHNYDRNAVQVRGERCHRCTKQCRNEQACNPGRDVGSDEVRNVGTDSPVSL